VACHSWKAPQTTASLLHAASRLPPGCALPQAELQVLQGALAARAAACRWQRRFIMMEVHCTTIRQLMATGSDT
jgi:hypothetical protein